MPARLTRARPPAPRLITRSPEETQRAGRRLAARLRPGDVVLLRGDLGTGKTVFARGVAAGLGVPARQVRSPSFTFVNPYHGRVDVHHVDLYRVDTDADLDELGLQDILGGEGVALVEWPERLGAWRPPACIEVTLVDRGGSRREIRIADPRPPHPGARRAGGAPRRHSRR